MRRTTTVIIGAGQAGLAMSRCLAERSIDHVLLERGDTVIGLDNFNDYYDVSLKEARAAILDDYDDFKMARINLQDRDAVECRGGQNRPQSGGGGRKR